MPSSRRIQKQVRLDYFSAGKDVVDTKKQRYSIKWKGSASIKWKSGLEDLAVSTIN